MTFIKYSLLIILILPTLSFAEDIQYVTGKLRLSLYKQADSGSEVIRLLSSGNRLDIIEIAGPYANVITDSGKEGWVKRGFLVKEKPAVILYNEVSEAYKDLQIKMQDFNDKNQSLVALEEKINTLEKSKKELLELNKNIQNQLKSEKIINKVEQVKSESKSQSELDLIVSFLKEYNFFLLSLLLLSLLVGFRGGELHIESKVIKHFGGVKVW